MPKPIFLIARILLGLIYFVFGGMGLAMALGLMKMPDPQMPEAAKAFMTGMSSAPYFMLTLKLPQVIDGLLLLIGVAVPFALVILAPMTLHIFLFHAFLTPGINQSILPIVMIILQVILMIGCWNVYRPLLAKRK